MKVFHTNWIANPMSSALLLSGNRTLTEEVDIVKVLALAEHVKNGESIATLGQVPTLNRRNLL